MEALIAQHVLKGSKEIPEGRSKRGVSLGFSSQMANARPCCKSAGGRKGMQRQTLSARLGLEEICRRTTIHIPTSKSNPLRPPRAPLQGGIRIIVESSKNEDSNGNNVQLCGRQIMESAGSSGSAAFNRRPQLGTARLDFLLLARMTLQ